MPTSISRRENGQTDPLVSVRAVVDRLRVRHAEIARAIYDRIWEAVPDSEGGCDTAYQAGVLTTVNAVLSYSLAAIEDGSGPSGPIPPEAASQARQSARVGVGVGAVLRRYVAAHGRLGEFIAEETARIGLAGDSRALRHISNTHDVLLGHFTATIENEHDQERQRITRPTQQRVAEIVQKLLSGTQVGAAELAELDYEIHGSWHVGIVVTGAGADEVVVRLRTRYGRELLAVALEGDVCVWLAARTEPTAGDIERFYTDGASKSALAVGEPARGIDGWCLTHAQARDAILVALHRSERFARYADDRLLAGTLQNDTLMKSLKQTYLLPLSSQRDGGAILRGTLRTYIELGCNDTSASHVLQVGRRSVKSRIRTAERLIGRRLNECWPELDVALRLDVLECDAISGRPRQR